jgi:hypothetical protein
MHMLDTSTTNIKNKRWYPPTNKREKSNLEVKMIRTNKRSKQRTPTTKQINIQQQHKWIPISSAFYFHMLADLYTSQYSKKGNSVFSFSRYQGQHNTIWQIYKLLIVALSNRENHLQRLNELNYQLKKNKRMEPIKDLASPSTEVLSQSKSK